jgi:surface protein
LIEIPTGFNDLDFSSVTTIKNIFQESGITTATLDINIQHIGIDISGWFEKCSNLTSVDISSQHFPEGADIEWIFGACFSLSEIIGIESFDNVNFGYMRGMFEECFKLTKIDFSKWIFGPASYTLGFKEFLQYVELETEYYDILLKTIASQDINVGQLLDCGFSRYSETGKIDRDYLTDVKGWTIIDGGSKDSFITTWTTTSTPQTITVPTTGTGYNGTIEWFDDTGTLVVSDTFSDGDMSGLAQELPTIGTYECRISGTFPRILCDGAGDQLFITTVENLGAVGWTSFYSAFRHCENMTSVKSGYCDTGVVTSFRNAFAHCYNLIDADLGTLGVEGAESLRSMFYNDALLVRLECSDWDTSNVWEFPTFVLGCIALIEVDVSSWDVSNGLSISWMFQRVETLAQLDITNWDTSKVTDMQSVFDQCINLEIIGLASLSVSSATTMVGMFASNPKLKTIPVTSWDISNVTTMSEIFDTDTDPLAPVTINTTGEGGYDEMIWYFASEHQAGRAQDNVPFHGGLSKYSIASKPAWDYLNNIAGWIITDGGMV